MTQLQTMYPGVANSPDTFLKERLTSDGVIMYVADGEVFGDLPTLAVIGDGQLAETIKVVSQRSDGGYDIKRGAEGSQRAWDKATTVARNWTNKDYETLRANITAINDGKVDKIAGKGLSTNDYDGEAKAKVDAIPPDPKYTDTVPDLSPYAKATDLSTEREERKADISKVMSDHATDIQNVKTAYTADINNAKAAHDADIKRLESQKLNKTDVVNDLTTGGVDKALSAEQGKTLFTYADNGKKSIADAIVGKGVDATKDDTFKDLAAKIAGIKTGYSAGEEVSSENVEEVKTFHLYENESDAELRQRKIEYTNETGDRRECGVPISLVVDSFGRPFVATSSGEVLSFNNYLSPYYTAHEGYSLTAISIRPNNELYKAEKLYPRIYKSGIGFFGYADKLHAKPWIVDVGAMPINALAAKYYYLYCGAGNKVVEINNSFEKTWEFTLHTAQVNAVAVGKDWNVYSGGADNKVFKISPKGKKIWEFTLHTAAVNAVAVDNEGYVYSGGADCKIYKISPDGKKVWEEKTNNKITALAVAPDGSILCGTTGSTFYTFQPDIAPPVTVELTYKNTDGTVVEDGDVVDIVVANDASIFYVTKKAKVITKMKLGYYTTSYKIIK